MDVKSAAYLGISFHINVLLSACLSVTGPQGCSLAATVLFFHLRHKIGYRYILCILEALRVFSGLIACIYMFVLVSVKVTVTESVKVTSLILY